MPDITDLSEREQEILKLVATGASNKEIAHHLTISTNTVKVHMRNIFGKTGAVSRTEAAMYAVKAGLVPGGPVALEEENPLASQRQTASQDSRTSRRTTFLSIILGLLVLGAIGLGTARLMTQNQPAAPTLQITAEPLWQIYPAMPIPRSGLGAAVYEGMIYTIGGETQTGISSAVQRYDPATQTWEDLEGKPTPVSDVQAAVLGGRMYIPGGKKSSGEVTNVLEIYDPQLDAWTQGAPLPAPLSAYALAPFEGKLYLFGGWDGEHYLGTVYEYDPSLDAWQKWSPMPTRRAYAGAAVAGRKIYVTGGTDGEKALAVSEVFSPDVAGDQALAWSSGVPMPEARYAMGASSVADTIYLIGGLGGPIQFPALAFFPQTGEWRSLEAPPLAVGSHLALVSLGTSLYALGGQMTDAPIGNNLAYKAMYTISIPLITK